MGYQRNEYYWCVMNKKIIYKKCTILCNVENLNMSHVDTYIISSLLSDIDA